MEKSLTATTFEALGLDPALLATLTESGYTTPTPVQAAAIPLLISGKDLLASAATGTGKTAAFLLPALMRLSQPATATAKGPRILVLTPTRELTQQVAAAAMTYGKKLKHSKVVTLTGGMPYLQQNKLLAAPYEIMVATPGRLIDQMNRGRIDFGRLEVLILDEADRMLDMGFREDIEIISEKLPRNRQTALFSATLDGVVGEISASLLVNPERLEIAPPARRDEQIEQKLHYADGREHKIKLVRHLIGEEHVEQAIVFTATKREAEALADELAAEGVSTASLHGDLNQRERNRTITKMKRNEVAVLVATDVAARGLDVSGINLVINYDLPRVAEDYVHRIGRTGRAGKSGVAISLVDREGSFLLKRVERFTGRTITPFTIEGLEARFSPKAGGRGPGGDRGDRSSRPQGDRSFGNRPRPQGDRGYGNRDGFNNRARPQGDNFGNRPSGERSFGDRPQWGNNERREGFGNRPPRTDGGFPPRDNRGPRPEFGQRPDNNRFVNRPARDQQPRSTGWDDNRPRFPSDSVRPSWQAEYQQQRGYGRELPAEGGKPRAAAPAAPAGGKPWHEGNRGGRQGVSQTDAHHTGHAQPNRRRSQGWFPTDNDLE